MARDKVLSLISLATKAGRCASGEFLTESETKSGRAGLVVVAEDASENGKAVPCIPGNIGRRICKRNFKSIKRVFLIA